MTISDPKIGAQYKLDGRIYEIISICDDDIGLCSLAHRHHRYVNHTDFANMEVRGVLRLHQPAMTHISREARFLSLSTDKQLFCREQIQILETCLKKFGGTLPRKETKNLLRTLAESGNFSSVPSYSTLAKRKKIYLANCCDPYSLLPQSSKPRRKHFSSPTEDHIKHYINTVYLTEERPSLAHTYLLLKGHIRAENKLRLKSGSLPFRIPSYATLRRRVNALDKFFVASRRYGPKAARKLNKFGGHLHVPSELGAMVHFDTHHMDVFAIDHEGNVLGRPTLSAHLELVSRMCVGWDIGIGAPCAEKMMRATMRMLVNYGNPGTISADHGVECFNNWVQNSCDLLGITLDYVPVGDCDAKAFMERFFGTVSKGFTHNLPGTCKSSPTERGDYPSDQRACLTISDLREAFAIWLEAYHDTKHSGINCTPQKKYEEMQKNCLPLERFDELELKNMLLGSLRLRLQGGRVKWKKLQWTGPGLPEIAQRLKKQQKAIIHYNPCDLGQVWVAHPDTPMDWQPAYATRPSYQEGLTVSEHSLLLEDLKAQNAEFDDTTACERLCELSEKINEKKNSNKGHKQTEAKSKPRSTPKSKLPAKASSGDLVGLLNAPEVNFETFSVHTGDNHERGIEN
ncbi:DNA-binding domain-containing protein [Pseudomonas asiatica]|uniref:DNA-binding domain-containing protein n=1 Tax=Pseudomonas asiatica TaxID=2219225 RepID=UPI0010BF749F|nr:DNA-binding domain-containing protein [Pseudomonas asiatica]